MNLNLLTKYYRFMTESCRVALNKLFACCFLFHINSPLWCHEVNAWYLVKINVNVTNESSLTETLSVSHFSLFFSKSLPESHLSPDPIGLEIQKNVREDATLLYFASYFFKLWAHKSISEKIKITPMWSHPSWAQGHFSRGRLLPKHRL